MATMGESAFFLGRGPAARILATVSHHPSPFFSPNTVRPVLLGHLAAGRGVLTATDPHTDAAAVEELLVEWRAAGSGHAEPAAVRELGADPGYASPNTDGTFPGPAPAGDRPNYDAAYAYDDGQLWWWNALRWHRLTVTGTAVSIGPCLRAPLLARPYRGYADTAALTLPQVAVWIMAELATRAMDAECGLPPQLYFAALVNPARHEIRFTTFGLRDHETIEFSTEPVAEVIPNLVQPIIQSHNQTNTAGPDGQRFQAAVDVLDERRQDHERQRGHVPGTVTVIDTGNPAWWT